MLTALGEGDATEQCAGAARQAMIIDESLTVSETLHWCAGALSHREAARLRRLTAHPLNKGPEDDKTTDAHIDDPTHRCLQARTGLG